MSDHLVWPEGPPCDPSCPGEWSQYHDGYAWGYEKGTAALDAALAREQRLREAGLDAAALAGMLNDNMKARDMLPYYTGIADKTLPKLRAALAETPK